MTFQTSVENQAHFIPMTINKTAFKEGKNEILADQLQANVNLTHMSFSRYDMTLIFFVFSKLEINEQKTNPFHF